MIRTTQLSDIYVNQTAHGFVVGDFLRHNGSSYVLATGASTVTSQVIGVVQSVTDANNFYITSVGLINGLTGLTVGSIYYLQNGGGYGLNPGTVSTPLFTAVTTTAGILALGRSGSVLPSNVRYVDVNGSNSNPGTISQPYLTIQYAVTALDTLGGGLILVNPGVYTGDVAFTDVSNVIIQGLSGDIHNDSNDSRVKIVGKVTIDDTGTPSINNSLQNVWVQNTSDYCLLITDGSGEYCYFENCYFERPDTYDTAVFVDATGTISVPPIFEKCVFTGIVHYPGDYISSASLTIKDSGLRTVTPLNVITGGDRIEITSVSDPGPSYLTYTTSIAHGLVTGDKVFVIIPSDTLYCALGRVIVDSATTFRLEGTNVAAFSATATGFLIKAAASTVGALSLINNKYVGMVIHGGGYCDLEGNVFYGTSLNGVLYGLASFADSGAQLTVRNNSFQSSVGLYKVSTSDWIFADNTYDRAFFVVGSSGESGVLQVTARQDVHYGQGMIELLPVQVEISYLTTDGNAPSGTGHKQGEWALTTNDNGTVGLFVYNGATWLPVSPAVGDRFLFSLSGFGTVSNGTGTRTNYIYEVRASNSPILNNPVLVEGDGNTSYYNFFATTALFKVVIIRPRYAEDLSSARSKFPTTKYWNGSEWSCDSSTHVGGVLNGVFSEPVGAISSNVVDAFYAYKEGASTINRALNDQAVAWGGTSNLASGPSTATLSGSENNAAGFSSVIVGSDTSETAADFSGIYNSEFTGIYSRRVAFSGIDSADTSIDGTFSLKINLTSHSLSVGNKLFFPGVGLPYFDITQVNVPSAGYVDVDTGYFPARVVKAVLDAAGSLTAYLVDSLTESIALACSNSRIESSQNVVMLGNSKTVVLRSQGVVIGSRASTNVGMTQSTYMVGRRTTTATPAELTLDGNAPSGSTDIRTANVLKIVSGSMATFSVSLVARRSDAVMMASYKFDGAIKNNAGTLTMPSYSKTIIYEDVAAWDCDVNINNTDDYFYVTVTGEAATTIDWSASVTFVEITA